MKVFNRNLHHSKVVDNVYSCIENLFRYIIMNYEKWFFYLCNQRLIKMAITTVYIIFWYYIKTA